MYPGFLFRPSKGYFDIATLEQFFSGKALKLSGKILLTSRFAFSTIKKVFQCRIQLFQPHLICRPATTLDKNLESCGLLSSRNVLILTSRHLILIDCQTVKVEHITLTPQAVPMAILILYQTVL